MYPSAEEQCDGIDNDCNNLIDDAIALYTYYPDADGDFFGDFLSSPLDTCLNTAPAGYVINNMDCDDNNAASNPEAVESCDGIDNNCNDLIDEGIDQFTYFVDADGDGFGDPMAAPLDTCLIAAPAGFVINNTDCNDNAAAANPDASEVFDGIDNDCNGLVDDVVKTVSPGGTGLRLTGYPNPTYDALTLMLDYQGVKTFNIVSMDGKTWISRTLTFVNKTARLDMSALAPGVYILQCQCAADEQITPLKIVKM